MIFTLDPGPFQPGLCPDWTPAHIAQDLWSPVLGALTVPAHLLCSPAKANILFLW